MKKLLYGIIVALFCFGCSNFLEEYSQSQTVAKKVSHFDELLLGDGYLPSVNKKYISTDHAGFLNVLDDDVTTVLGGIAVHYWSEVMQKLFGYYAWQLEVGRNSEGNILNDDSQTWLDFYRRINVTNIILKEIDELKVDSPAEENDRVRVKGECHFIRASLYFTLVNLYGKAYSKTSASTDLGVPLKLTEYIEHDKDKETQFQRASVAQIYEQIVKDLKASVDYLTQSPQPRPLHRASKEAAQLLLSRVYLYMQDWNNAAAIAAQLLENDTRLHQMNEGDSAKIFLSENCSEVLFSQGSMNLHNSMTGASGDFAVSEELVELYDRKNDFRRYFFGTNPNSFAYKLQWKYDTTAIPHVSDIYTLRISEGYLNLAEAYAMQDNTEGANRYLKTLREKRIKGYVHTNYTGEELINEIRLERRKELCFEGHRWFDLRRYAVCEKYPHAQKIIHEFNVFDGNQNFWDHTDIYELPENDPAYVMQIPKSVLEYDETQMPENPRNKRNPVGEDE
ncbi:MAG: RagB/SusD family nutrient uptake outer membrane protein [Odoribacter sp.]|nr:RagB/SusD family nutrient uptake outer membrane protein [Odoribacter sp.]MDY3034300.1 RagB/SusD family nutrient uptake outer membrane protein [Odoribacter sp.]